MRSCGFLLASLVLSFASPSGGLAAAYQAQGIRGDPVTLNIGLICQWQRDCIARQRGAMTKSLKYVAKYRPPQWRIHVCNKNASRGGQRKDWIGFDKCVRNESLRPPPPPPPRAKKKTIRKRRS